MHADIIWGGKAASAGGGHNYSMRAAAARSGNLPYNSLLLYVILKYSVSADHIIIILLVSIYNHARELTDGRTNSSFSCGRPQEHNQHHHFPAHTWVNDVAGHETNTTYDPTRS